MRRSSVVFCRTSRPLFKLFSNCSSNSLRVFHAGGLNFEPPGGLMSSSSMFTTMSSYAGMLATMVARLPSGMDFSCGFQSFFPSGTRCSVFRIPTASRSSSASNSSVIFMGFLRVHFRCLAVEGRIRNRLEDLGFADQSRLAIAKKGSAPRGEKKMLDTFPYRNILLAHGTSRYHF
jgi:hypothetical protein